MAKIMAWSACAIEIGRTGTDDAMASTLMSVGVIKDKSCELSSEDGEELEMKSTGGATVGYEKQEGTATLKCRVIEPEDTFFTTLFGIGTLSSTDVYVSTHVIADEYSVKVTPNKIGAKGIMAPKCTVSISSGWSEEDGNYVDLTFGILHGAQVDGNGNSYWYKRFVSNGITAGTDGYTSNE